jgi:hypothetical protein
MKFFLGTSQPHWLADSRFDAVPLFISRRRLARYAKLPDATTDFALDSGGFTELQMHGMWTMTADAYAEEVRRYAAHYGRRLLWVAPQDWMCEPIVIAGGRAGTITFEGTGLSVREHQRRTVLNFVRLRRLLGELVVPVLQGWTLDDYLRCVELYERHGVKLWDESIVGLGSVCRRQATKWAAKIVTALAAEKIRLHGFGFKKDGVERCRDALASADSMAWAVAARWEPPIDGHLHQRCVNCAEFALRWRAQLLAVDGGALPKDAESEININSGRIWNL